MEVTRATTLSTSTSSLAFGNVTKGSSKTLNASIDYNNTTYNQQVTGTAPTGYSVTATTVGATGTGQSIPVVFTPTTVGSHTGTVTLTMNGKTCTFTVSGTGVTTYYAQANATASTGGSAYVSFTSADAATTATATKNSGTVSTTSATATAYYKAVPASGYVFLGWTLGSASSYSASTSVSTSATYSPSITYTSENSASPTTETYKAWFAPMFYFSATPVSSNSAYGTADVSYSESVQGAVGATSASATVTFTATPKTDCTFEGWYDNSSYSGTPVSTNATYAVTLDNTSPGSTTSKTLYAHFRTTQNLQWADPDLDLNLVNGTTASSAATVTSGKTITYTSSNTDAITVDADGTLHAVGLGTSVITASVESDFSYNAASLTREFSVGEKKQATFTPAWGESLTTDIKVGTSTTIALTNVASDATFTITNGDATILGVTRDGNTLTIEGLKAGETTLTLSQTGNTFLNGNTATYTIIVSRYANTFAVADETKAMKVEDEWTGVVTNTGNGNTQVSYSTAGITTYDATNNKIVAQAEGSTTITFTQAETTTHAGTTKTIAVTVTKVANTLAISLPTQAAEVDDAITLSITGQNNVAAIVGTITETSLSSSVNNGTDVITFANGVITARNAGTAKIKFSQAATTKYTAYESDTYEITVSKKANAITITNLGGGTATNIKLKSNETAVLAYTSTNTDTSPVVTRTSGTFTTLSGSTITAGNAAGTDIYAITQAETYKYEAGYTSFTVRVNNTDEVDGYVLHQEGESYTGNWSEGATLTMTGPGDLLSFQATKNMATAIGDMIVKISTNGNDWSTRESIGVGSLNKDDYKPFSYSLDDEAIRYVRFDNDGSYRKYYKDVKVRRKTYVRASSNTTNLGTLYTDQTASSTFTVNYSSTNGGNINISSNNPHFVPSISSISVVTNKKDTDKSTNNNTEYICGVDGTQTFTVTYTPDPDNLGEESAVITIGDLFYSQQITLTATSRKYDTSIARGSNTATATTVDGTIANAFAFSGTSTAAPSANSSDDFYYTISHTQTSNVNNGDAVISYDPATNTITGLNAGTARLTIYQKKTQKYHATSQSFDFTVTKLANNASIALSATELDVDGTATVQLTNNDSEGALSAAFSNVSYSNEVQNREGGLLSFDGTTLTGVNAGSATVTITQAETYKYEGKSQQFTVSVNKLAQTLTWDTPDLTTTMQVGSTLNGNTATSDAGLSPVTYSSGNTAAITVDATTGVLTAVATGSNITITATQAGNYKYLPATLTRQFSVFNKQTPAFTPDASFTGNSGRIMLYGTATITVTGVSTGDDFTITNGNSSLISVVRDGETITITALAVGSTTLTLTQVGNDDYLAKSQTYDIEVYWPDDYLLLAPATAPTHSAATYAKVFLSRTLPAGYSSLALPFATTVEALTGRESSDDWVAQLHAVTYNAADGYTLYFNKVEGGAIEANEPYVLHLGAEVVEPEWTDVTVSAADAQTVTAQTGYGSNVTSSTYSGWSMTSNFTPNFDMNGKFGIVNSGANSAGGQGGLKRGGSGSKLNAFTAYITAPAAATLNVKTRAAIVDEDGTVTVIGGLAADDAFDASTAESSTVPAAIFGPDGKHRSRLAPGVNIVRNADGTVRKIFRASN